MTQSPELPSGEIANCVHVDETYWVAWVRTYRTTRVDLRLQEARELAAIRCEETLQASAVRITEERGLGNEECIKFGCDKRAVAGMAYCSRCLAELDRGAIARVAEYDELAKVVEDAPWS